MPRADLMYRNLLMGAACFFGVGCSVNLPNENPLPIQRNDAAPMDAARSDGAGGVLATDATQPVSADSGSHIDARAGDDGGAEVTDAMVDMPERQMPDVEVPPPGMGRVDPVDMAVEDPQDAAVDIPCNVIRLDGERLQVRGFEYRIESPQREESGCVEAVDTQLLDVAGLAQGPVTFTWTGRVRRTDAPISLAMRIESSPHCDLRITWMGVVLEGIEFVVSGVPMGDSLITVRNHCLSGYRPAIVTFIESFPPGG